MTICQILSNKFRTIGQMVGRGYKEYHANNKSQSSIKENPV